MNRAIGDQITTSIWKLFTEWLLRVGSNQNDM